MAGRDNTTDEISDEDRRKIYEERLRAGLSVEGYSYPTSQNPSGFSDSPIVTRLDFEDKGDNSNVLQPIPSASPKPSTASRLEKRKLLAEELRKFAAGESEQTAESLIAQGAQPDVGVSRKQLSNLYKQYKKEIGSELMAGPPKPDGVGEPSVSSVKTPNLDRLAQMQNEPIGSRPMGSERRIITSPEGQMRLMARKAARAGIDIGQLVSANKGDVMAAFGELEAAGFGAKGIRTQEEVRSQPALQAQAREARASLLKEQAEAVRKAEAERIAKEEEKERRKQEQQMPKGDDIWAV